VSHCQETIGASFGGFSCLAADDGEALSSLTNRIEERRNAAIGQRPVSASPESLATYNDLLADLAERVSRLSAYRTRSDRSRMVHQLAEIDSKVHAMLAHLGAPR
jgi:hypothetical protein